jgi:hypothetical protein
VATAVAAIITALGTFGTALVAYLEHRRQRYPKNNVAAQSVDTAPEPTAHTPSVLVGPKGRLAILATVGAALGVVSIVLFTNSWSNSRSSSAGATGATPITAGAPTTTVFHETTAAPSSTPSTTSPAPIQITDPPKVAPKSSVPQVISVRGTGDVPDGKHLWIFVYSPDVATYYPQDNPVQTLDQEPWTVSGVEVGSSDPQERGHGFAIYAVLVDDQTQALISANSNGFNRDNWQRLFLPYKVDEVSVQRR